MNPIIDTTTSASKGLRNISYLITAGCIAASMSHVYMFLQPMFEAGMFLNLTLFGSIVVLIGGQVILALTTQATMGKMPVYIIGLGLAGWLFVEGMFSVPLSQVAINNSMINATASQTESSQEAVQIRNAIERSSSRINGMDATLEDSDASNMTNRGAVLESIATEERKIKQYREELKTLDESSSSVAFSETMYGMGREGLTKTMSAAFSIVPAVMTIMVAAMAYGRRKQAVNVTDTKTAPSKVGVRKKLKATIRQLAA